MIRELTVENFRAFRTLHLASLGRVNLLVGTNNSGKTSVLEAVSFLASGGDPLELHSSLYRRGEQSSGDDDPSRSSQQEAVDVRHVFFGRKIGDHITATISAVAEHGAPVSLGLSTPRVSDDALPEWRDAVARPRRRSGRGEPVAIDVDRSGRMPRFLEVSSGRTSTIKVPLLLGGGLTEANATVPKRIEAAAPVLFVSTLGLDEDELAKLYDKIVLTPDETLVITALRQVEPGISRIATRQLNYGERGFVVGMEGSVEQVPLGGLGDGVHRMLAIALSLVTARGGYLLIDEIDTGLHHTVMRKMWALVFDTAKRLNIQVFATTHSYDCVHALSAIALPDDRASGEVVLIRVERDNPQGVLFSEQEISHLAEWRIEAR